LLVIPAKAGIQFCTLICGGKIKNWTPAFAGVTTGRVMPLA